MHSRASQSHFCGTLLSRNRSVTVLGPGNSAMNVLLPPLIPITASRSTVVVSKCFKHLLHSSFQIANMTLSLLIHHTIKPFHMLIYLIFFTYGFAEYTLCSQ